MFSDLTDSLIVYSRGWTASEAMDAFIGGFNQLSNAPIDPMQQQSIVDYYNDVFAKVEDAQTGHAVDVNALLPTSNAQRYLQAHYTAPFADPNAAVKNDDARDGRHGRPPMPGSTTSSARSSRGTGSRTRV